MKYFEAFAGVGGFGIGIQNAYLSKTARKKQRRSPHDSAYHISERLSSEQPTCVGFSEIDKYAFRVLKYHHPNIKNYGNIKEIDWNTVPDFDLLVGGSPCQDLSIAGKRAGLAGTRSGLFTEYIRCLKEKKPQHFIWENVKGALSSNNGWDFARVLIEMAEVGYSLQWQVLNAKHFGVPQNRERVFVIGTRGECGREVFFEQGTNGKDIQNLERGANQAGRRYDTKGIAPTIPTAGGGRHIPMIQAMLTPNRLEKRQHGRRVKESGEPMFTITGQDIHGIIINEEDK